MFLAFAIMGWSFILLGASFQIFIAVVSLIDTTFVLPSFLNGINLFSKKAILNQPYLTGMYSEPYMVYLIPSLLILVAISVFAVSIYELIRMKKGQLLAKPYVKIYFIVLIVASLVFGQLGALILAACLFVALILFETALFNTEGLKNYFEEREIIAINREEKSFEKEVNKPGKHKRSVEKKQEMENENTINSKLDASSKANDNSETIATFNYPKSILDSADKVSNYDVFQNEIDEVKKTDDQSDNNDNEFFAELGTSSSSKDPYAELAEDEENTYNNDVNMFGQSSITAEKLNYIDNKTTDENKFNFDNETAFLEEQKFEEDKIVESPQKDVETSDLQDDSFETFDFDFNQIDDVADKKDEIGEDNFTSEQIELTETVADNEQLAGKKPYRKWTKLQSNIIMKLDQINELQEADDQKSQLKTLKKLQKEYNKKVKRANILADKLNLQQDDYFKYIEIASAKANIEIEEENFDNFNDEQFELQEAEQQIDQTLDIEEEFNFDLLQTQQEDVEVDNTIETNDNESNEELQFENQQLQDDEQEVELIDVQLEQKEDQQLTIESNPANELDLQEQEIEEHIFEEQEVEEHEDIIPAIKVENANLFKFEEQTIDNNVLSNSDVFNDIEKIDEEELPLKEQQISNQEQLIKEALNDEKWEQRFDLFDNRLTKLEKIMIDSSFQKIEKDKNFEKLHLDLNQIQNNLKKISDDVAGLEEKTHHISKAITNERSANNLSKPAHTIEQHYPKIDDFNFNLSKYSLYNRSGYSNTYGVVSAQDTSNKYNGPRRVSDYNKIKSKGYSGDYSNSENIERMDYGHASLHNISKYTKETVPFEDNCSLCKKMKA